MPAPFSDQVVEAHENLMPYAIHMPSRNFIGARQGRYIHRSSSSYEAPELRDPVRDMTPRSVCETVTLQLVWRIPHGRCQA